jgi:hypothetical protein
MCDLLLHTCLSCDIMWSGAGGKREGEQQLGVHLLRVSLARIGLRPTTRPALWAYPQML